MEEGSGKAQDFQVVLKDINLRLGSLSASSGSLTPDKNSYMDLKLNLLLNHYILYTLKLLQDKSTPSTETVKSLLKHRCFLERLKPLDNKLQYQLDKIAQCSLDEDLKLKPNPTSMDTTLRVNESTAVYKPPKIQAAIFNDKYSKSDRDHDRLKKKLARSTLIKSLKEEFDDNPVEIKSGRNKRVRDLEEMQRKYEEDNFIRVNLSKDEKRRRRRLEKSEDDDEGEDVSALLKLMKPGKAKLNESLKHGRKQRKFED